MNNFDFKLNLNYNEWLPFFSKTLELLICGIIYIFVIDNFLIKTYIPGEILYPLDPCDEPYVTNTKSRNPFERVNPYQEYDQAEAQRMGSRVQTCNTDNKNIIEEFGKGNTELKNFLYNLQQTSKVDISMLYSSFRTFNKKRAGKIEYHGFIYEIIYILLLIYFKSSIETRGILKSIHNLIGSFDLKNVYIFSALLFFSLCVYFVSTQTLGSNVPWYNFVYQIFTVIFSLIGGIIGIAIFIAAISFVTNAFNTFTHLPLTCFFTGLITLPLGVGLGFAALQTFVLILQLIKGLILDPLFNTNIRNIVSCDIFNYKTPIILILILFSLLNAVLYLKEDNLTTYVITVFVFLIYTFFISTSENKLSSTCEKSNIFVDNIKKMGEKYANNNNNANNANNANSEKPTNKNAGNE